MNNSFALDFGSALVRVADQSGIMLVEEPCLAALEEGSGRLVAFGRGAVGLGPHSAGRLRLVHPVLHGHLVDLDVASSVVAVVLEKAGMSRLSRSRVLVVTHVDTTDVQRRALERSLKKAGVRQIRFVEAPVACVIGAGLPIEEPIGRMVVDVGAGTTDIAVLALGGIVASIGLRIGGETFESHLRSYLVRRHGLVLDAATSTALCQEIGPVDRVDPVLQRVVAGRDLRTGAVRDVEIHAVEVAKVLSELARTIVESATRCITHAPPDLANDLLSTGLILAGGGGEIPGFDQMLAKGTGVPVHVLGDGGRLAVLGAARCLSSMSRLDAALSASSRR